MHTLIELTYDYNALEPHIDARTMEIHHTKHHQKYVDKLNAALEKFPDLESQSLIELIANLDKVPEEIRTAVRNHGGGVANHNLFFTLMGPDGGGKPQGEVGDAIDVTFGGFDQFQAAFTEAALGRFGSGWAWLSQDADGKLRVESTANQDNPFMFGRIPILGVDVWEHAYYLKYQNRRPEYVEAWWNAVSWEQVNNHFKAQTVRTSTP